MGYSSLEHFRKQILGFEGKTDCAWSLLKGKCQVVDRLRGFSVFISVAPCRASLMAETLRDAIA